MTNGKSRRDIIVKSSLTWFALLKATKKPKTCSFAHAHTTISADTTTVLFLACVMHDTLRESGHRPLIGLNLLSACIAPRLRSRRDTLVSKLQSPRHIVLDFALAETHWSRFCTRRDTLISILHSPRHIVLDFGVSRRRDKFRIRPLNIAPSHGGREGTRCYHSRPIALNASCRVFFNYFSIKIKVFYNFISAFFYEIYERFLCSKVT